MIRLGLCMGIDAVDPKTLRALADIGYEYIELGLTAIAGLTDKDYDALLESIRNGPLKVEACNGMLPGTFRLTGPDADLEAPRAYLEAAYARAAALGTRRIVFGSGGARNVPEGAEGSKAWDQLAAYCRMASDLLPGGMAICIEPLRPEECNIVNTVAGAVYLADRVGRENVRCLADLYHIACQGENLEGVLSAGQRLQHCHIANPDGRGFPKAADAFEYRPFFEALRLIGYRERLSIEGGTKDLVGDAREAFGVLDGLRRREA